MNHFLTFILPCFNYADIIEQSLESIYQQELKIPFEVICTDDCSTDERTREILRKWEKLYGNFYAYFHTENKCEGGACNTCIKHSKGDLFFCLDTDNVLVPNSVQGLVDLIDKTGCDGACFHRLEYFKEVDGKYIIDTARSAGWIFEAPNNIIDMYHIIHAAVTPAMSGNYLFTRESFDRAGGYPENNCMGSWGFGFRQHATGSKIAILPDTFYWHRVSDDGLYLMSHQKGLCERAMTEVAIKFPEIYTDKTWRLIQSKEYKDDFRKLLRRKLVELKKGL